MAAVSGLIEDPGGIIEVVVAGQEVVSGGIIRLIQDNAPEFLGRKGEISGVFGNPNDVTVINNRGGAVILDGCVEEGVG